MVIHRGQVWWLVIRFGANLVYKRSAIETDSEASQSKGPLRTRWIDQQAGQSSLSGDQEDLFLLCLSGWREGGVFSCVQRAVAYLQTGPLLPVLFFFPLSIKRK